jgi:type IV pilus assembly protein PilO
MAPPAKNKGSAAQASLAEQFNPPAMVAAGIMAAAGVCALYYYLGYEPTEAEIAVQVQRKSQIEGERATAERDLRAYNDDVAELERLRNQAREQQRVLPDNPDIPGFLDSINRTATDTGLTIRLVQPEAEAPAQYYARIPVRVEVNGTFLDIARFFRSVGQMPRVINMENITLSQPVVGPDGKVRLDARMLATTFRALTAAEQAAAAPAAPTARRPAGGNR